MDRQIPRLKLIRWKKGLTQKELAQRAGLPVWKISRWEDGTRKPTIVEIALIQKVLKDDLFVLNPLELEELRNRECPKISTIRE
jgi:DNA-binding transcriptional regulator YiaG